MRGLYLLLTFLAFSGSASAGPPQQQDQAPTLERGEIYTGTGFMCRSARVLRVSPDTHRWFSDLNSGDGKLTQSEKQRRQSCRYVIDRQVMVIEQDSKPLTVPTVDGRRRFYITAVRPVSQLLSGRFVSSKVWYILTMHRMKKLPILKAGYCRSGPQQRLPGVAVFFMNLPFTVTQLVQSWNQLVSELRSWDELGRSVTTHDRI